MSAILKDSLLQMRPMRQNDINQVIEVERSSYAFPWTPGVFRDCLRVGYCSWVVQSGQQIIGYAVMSVAADEAHILNICIHPAFQGRGLAKRLLRWMLSLARLHHANNLFLEVRVSNRPALKLYDGLGFNEIGMRKDYYPAPGGREDAVLLARSLNTCVIYAP